MDFKNSVTVRPNSKRTIKNLLHISPHLKRVATLPWKKIVCKNCGDEAQRQQTRRAHTEENVNAIQLIHIIMPSEFYTSPKPISD